MKRLLPLLFCLLYLPACQTVRTVYDEHGNEVVEHSGERTLEDYMTETFDRDVTRKKNEDGVPESSSTKVSRYQKDLDAARKDTTTFRTGSFSGVKSLSRDKSFSGAGKQFDTGSSYDGTFANKSYSRDLRPDFMSDTKGVFSREDTYGGISSSNRADGDGQSYDPYGTENIYGTGSSNISRTTASSYIETRREKTPKPRIVDHKEYYKKSLYETRALLGRDNEPPEE